MHAPTHITIEARARRRTPGFSLIELVLVMTIIAVLSAIAVPRYADALARYRADAAARRVVADLNYARQRARSSSTSVKVKVKPALDCLEIVGEQSMDDPAGGWITDLSASPYLADMVSSDFSGNKVVFNGYGYPDSGGLIVLTVSSESRTIVLDADTGKAVVQ